MNIDLKVGDIILGGRFKNKRMKVKEFGKDDLGQYTVNGRKLLSYRLEKLMPKDKQSRKTQEMNMDKKAVLAEIRDAAIADEFQKIAGDKAYRCPKCGYEGNKPGDCPKCDAQMVKK